MSRPREMTVQRQNPAYRPAPIPIPQKVPFMFFHAVYFYPRQNATPVDAVALAAACRKWLAPIPGVTFFDVGFPAMTPRDVVDNSYAVALLVGYESVAAHDIYQDHPDHLSFIAENSHLWSKVTVFDSVSA